MTDTNWQVLGASASGKSYLVCDESRYPRIMNLDPPIIWPQSTDGNDEFGMTWYTPEEGTDLTQDLAQATVYDSLELLPLFEELNEVGL